MFDFCNPGCQYQRNGGRHCFKRGDLHTNDDRQQHEWANGAAVDHRNPDDQSAGPGPATIQRFATGPQFRLFHVANSGSLTLDAVNLLNGNAGVENSGGAIYNTGHVSVNGGTMMGGDGSSGGALYNSGQAFVLRSSLIQNHAGSRGGAIYNETGDLTIEHTRVANNAGVDAAVRLNAGSATITDSFIADNTFSFEAGGLDTTAATVDIRRTTFSNNFSQSAGAIRVNSGTVTISDSAFVGNRLTDTGAGADILTAGGTVTVVSTTFYHSAPNAAVVNGRSISNLAGDIVLRNSTVVQTSQGVGSLQNANSIFTAAGAKTTLQNTILTHTPAVRVVDCRGPVTSLGNNIINDTTDCSLVLQPTDLTGDPKLDAFTDNSEAGNGHFPLLPTSPAVNAGANACPARDQIGEPRVGTCDIGAIEFVVPTALSGGGSVTNVTPGAAATVTAGYAQARVKTGVTPYATAVFSLKQNGFTVSETGVPASPPMQNAGVFVEYRSGVSAGTGTISINTGVAIANVSSASASITFTLRDSSGAVLATGQGSLAAGRHVAKFVDQLSQVAPNFTFPASFSTTTGTGSLEITSSEPVSIVALLLTVNQRAETLMTTTPVANIDAPLTNRVAPLVFPQFAEGGGYTTSVVLLNTSSSTETGTIALFDNAGAAVAVQSSTGTTASSFAYSIPANGTAVFQTSGSSAAIQAGSIRVIPVSGNAPVGSAIFAYSPSGILVSRAGVPAAQETTLARIYVDTSANHDTGIALVDASNGTNAITVRAFQPDGATTAGNGSANITLSANGHIARFAGEMIVGLPSGFTGVLEISSASPFAAVTLRSLTNGRNDFLMTTFPVADATRAAPAPIVFPQIADGGGYSTQFIFLSAAGASAFSLESVFDQ
jgi:hypothetical protein